MSYDRQVIVQLGFDSIIAGGAQRLNSKSLIPSKVVAVHPSTAGGGGPAFRYADVRTLTSEFATLTTQSRVYLQGHGDWINQKLEGFDAETIAALLANARMPRVKIVSVLGCSLARDLNTRQVAEGASGNMRVAQIDSFASKLHAALGRRGIPSDVYARVFNVGVYNGIPGQGPYGSKITFADSTRDDSWDFQRPESKLVFTWVGNQQHREWKY